MTSFDKERDFEQALIDMLSQKGWEREVLQQPTEEALVANWAAFLFQTNNSAERLNDAPLSEEEMQQLLDRIEELRTPVALNGFINDRTVHLKRTNPADPAHLGKEIALKIFDPQEIAAGQSRYQIARQPRFHRGAPLRHDRRGDLTLLINGLPMIHIELKRSGIPVSQAYHQIEMYSREGVFTGLFSLIQIFVAMTPEETVYFANPGRDGRFNQDFYFHWCDFNNNPYKDWRGIATYFLSIPMAHQLIGYYTVADRSDGVLKVLRSYQFEAVRAIYDTVAKRREWHRDGSQLGGYIWHTTGSGKTLSSFKAAQLVAMNRLADKVVFVIDRIELGTQSAREYRNFAGAAEEIQETEDTDVLVSKLISPSAADMLIVTSIQKLGIIADDVARRESLRAGASKRIVFIVDECHRSTFGETFASIKTAFPTALFFGFTGTPIQIENQKKGNTTSDIFGNELHRYSIADGIRDGNVLGFDPYRVTTFRDRDLRVAVALEKVKAHSIEAVDSRPWLRPEFDAWMSLPMAGETLPDGTYRSGIEDFVPSNQYETEEHCRAVVSDIVEDIAIRSRGGRFHALFATSSIPQAIRYYRLFKAEAPSLRVTALFDPSLPNDNPSGVLPKESGLEEIVGDYNARYGQSFDLSMHQRFKKDIASRLAHKAPYINLPTEAQLDLLIVVSQMLTGFDSKWINTLYIDKMMGYADLIQAFSRTNRLFGPEKPFGVIKYYYRPHTMERNIKEAVRLYSGNRELDIFVNKLGKNIEEMNRVFEEISQIFASEAIVNFSQLPEEEELLGCFAKLFREYNQLLEAAKLQGFRWDRLEYTIDGKIYKLRHTERSYNALLQRYKELFSLAGRRRRANGDAPYDIDPYIMELDTGKIDTEYMNRNFRRYAKALRQEGVSEQELHALLNELSASFAFLSQAEQRCAEVFLHDIQSNNVELDANKTFRDYIVEYMRNDTEQAIDKLVADYGVDREKLVEILNSCPRSSWELGEFGKFDDLCKTVDISRASAHYGEDLGEPNAEYRVRIRVDKELRDFILGQS